MSHRAAPDLVIAGAARSGTSLLAAHLSAHPQLDGGAVKEPNFFSRDFERGWEWYDGLFVPRSEKEFRLDASVSYTYPQYLDALPRLASAAPGAVVAYVVRDPVARAISHYQLNKVYFGHERAATFGEALRERSFYADVSDYTTWIDRLRQHVPDEQLVIVPFDLVRTDVVQVATNLVSRLGLPPPPRDEKAVAHQNEVVAYRSEGIRRASRWLRHSPAYPLVRRTLSPHVLRRVRAAVTRKPDLPSIAEVLGTCTPEQLARLEDLRVRVSASVLQRLQEQDRDQGLSWADTWSSRSVDALAVPIEQAAPTSGGSGQVPADEGERD